MSRRVLITILQCHLGDDGANREDSIIDLFEFEWDEWVWPMTKQTLEEDGFPKGYLNLINRVKNELLDEYKKDFKAWDNVSWEAIEDELDRHIINKIKER